MALKIKPEHYAVLEQACKQVLADNPNIRYFRCGGEQMTSSKMKYEVIESRVWQSGEGRKVSVYGALPWHSDAQKLAEGWQMVTQGWTVRNPYTGEVGVCRVPWKSREEAQEYADTHEPGKRPMYD